jgi:aldehyde dehydrogenase (NAD+)
MSEEIFGPVLPIFTYSDLDEVISYVNEGEKPLTMYIFSSNQKTIKTLSNRIMSGSVLINDCLFQFGNYYAPFGGVGHSGLGGYHGKFSFDCFSQKRPILHRDGTAILDIPIR